MDGPTQYQAGGILSAWHARTRQRIALHFVIEQSNSTFSSFPFVCGPIVVDVQAGKPTPLDDPVVTEIAARLSKSPGQVVLRWGLQSGHVVIPKATNPVHIQQNAEALHEHALIELREGETPIELSEEHMCRLNALPVNLRLVNPPFGANGAGAFEL
jgi:diketogulonate reductase-like aldo/keto reductase